MPTGTEECAVTTIKEMCDKNNGKSVISLSCASASVIANLIINLILTRLDNERNGSVTIILKPNEWNFFLLFYFLAFNLALPSILKASGGRSGDITCKW